MKNKEKVIAVLEVASASVAGILFRQNEEGGKIRVLSCHRLPINFLFDISFEASWRCTQDGLKKVIKSLLKSYPLGPRACLCVLLSPWFLSQIKTVEVRRERPFKLTKEFFDLLRENEERNFKMKIENQLGKTNFIEHEIIKTELNGYYTRSPIGKLAKTVKLCFYLSLGIKEMKERVEKEILENFGDIPLLFRTFPLLSFLVLNNIFTNPEGFILVDLGGEITDLSLIRRNCLEETISFPRGRNFLIRKISSTFKTFPQEASSLLRAYSNGHITEKDSGRISKIIEEAKKEWGNFFENAIKKISETSPLPQDVLLVGEEIVGDQFLKFAEDDRFSQFTVLGKPLMVKRITAQGLNHYFESPGEQPLDVFTIIETLFANKIF